MSKLSKLSQALKILLQKPYMINKVIDSEDVHKDAVLSISNNYQEGLPTIDFTEVLPNFNATINPYSFLDGGSMITDLALLKGMAKKYNDCTYFEIGTWRGESVANVAETAKECFTLNLSNERLREIGLREEYIAQQSFYSKNLNNVVHLKGDSATFDFSPYHGKCDVVFVDGDHHYEAVKRDTAIAFQLIKDKNSVIVWHDYAHNPEKTRWDVFRGILEGTPKNKRKQLYHVSNTMCALFTQKTYQMIDKSKLIIPTKKFEVQVKALEIKK
ncbi:MAG: class I SAM-dependent methyltransferase [Flavobacteriales bacterium]|nr:class I SAM-dependent methyltransferase [Flavobacteriales bacterium]MCB9335007.1 class I SAM-dependent methyltransferase [Flavobacteriales bacterium]